MYMTILCILQLEWFIFSRNYAIQHHFKSISKANRHDKYPFGNVCVQIDLIIILTTNKIAFENYNIK